MENLIYLIESRAKQLEAGTGSKMNKLLFQKETGECYLYLYDNVSRDEALRSMGRYACNPDLSLTWPDVAVLSHMVRKSSH